MQLPQHKTKLVCTIGPASNNRETLEQMILRGLSVARLNFAHGDFAAHRNTIATIRDAARAVGRRVAILADLPGPKIRLGTLHEEPVELAPGDTLVLTCRSTPTDSRHIPVQFPALPNIVQPNHTIYLNDGFIQLKVIAINGQEVECQALVGGLLRSHKGLNVPGVDLGISAFTDEDRRGLQFAVENGIDAVSQSFVQGPHVIAAVRAAAAEYGRIPYIFAKIERSLALENYDAILEAADGIMVARGDLGVEIPLHEIAVVQKRLIRKANLLGKPVITATQMLESMVTNRRPTRAEVTDVANAILDGTDCVMLSEESATGAYPLEAVAMLASIAQATEAEGGVGKVRETLTTALVQGTINVEDLITLSVHQAVKRLPTVAILTPTHSGSTARRITRFRLPVWIVAMSTHESTCQALQFSYGVHPVYETDFQTHWEDYARRWLQQQGVTQGLAVLAQGPSSQHRSGTNDMRVIDLGQPADNP
jgi:pyruvate kinase